MTALPEPSTAIASYWLSAVSTGFAGPTSWKNWADTLIERLEQPPVWIIDMSLANTPDDLFKAVEERKAEEDRAAGNVIPLGNAKLGFYYLRYERGDYALDEFLSVAGDEADGGTADLPCESVFEILNNVERARDDAALVAELASKTKDMFSSYKRTAQEQWAAIQSASGE